MEKVMLVFDKPECCDNCPAFNRKNYTCGGTWNHILKGFKRYEEKRGPNCPLKPLPQGHGRLIDADAFQKYCFNKNFDKRLSDGGLATINLFLGFQPTIIEADTGETG